MTKKYIEYGYKPGQEIVTLGSGLHTFRFEAIKSYENGVVEPGVMIKELHEARINRPVSAPYKSRREFFEEFVKPLERDLQEMDKYFGEFLPPYYMEVGEESETPGSELNIPVRFCAYRVTESGLHTEEINLLFQRHLAEFFEKCLLFLKKQWGETPGLRLPDIKPDNFIFGTHMGDQKPRLYFVDLFPVFIPAETILKSPWVQELKDVPPMSESIQKIFRWYDEERWVEP